MSLLGSLIGPVADLGKTWLEGKVAKTKAKAEAEAKVMTTQAQSAADWETAMARASNQSWKDEWITILFSIPYLKCTMRFWVWVYVFGCFSLFEFF